MSGHWLNAERLRQYPRIFLALYVFSAILTLATSHGGLDAFQKPLGHDFITYWSASRLALSGNPASAYDVMTIVRTEWTVVPGIRTLNPWVYPPTFFLVVLPLSLIPYFLSYALFMGGTFACYFAVVRRAFSNPAGIWLLLAFPGVYVNIEEGQNAFLTAALMGGGLLLLPASPVYAGILFGLLTIKPHLGLLLPLALICGRQWRALLAAAVTASAFLALSLWILGTDTLPAFIDSLKTFPLLMFRDGKLAVKVTSLLSALSLLGVPRTLAFAAQAVVSVSVAGVVGWVWLRCKDAALRASALATGSLLVTPYVLNYDLAWLALPIAWVARRGLENGWLRWDREVLAASWVLPLVVAPLAYATHLQLGPVVVGALFVVIVRHALRQVRQPARLSAAAPYDDGAAARP